MKNCTKKLTLLAVALVATSSVFSSNRISKIANVVKRGFTALKAQQGFPFRRAFSAQNPINALTTNLDVDRDIQDRLANFAGQAALAKNPNCQAISDFIKKFQLNARGINLAAAGGNLSELKFADSNSVLLEQLTARQDLVVPLIGPGEALNSFKNVPARDLVEPLVVPGGALNSFKNVPVIPNATGRNFAIAGAALATVAGVSCLAYYFFGYKPAATLATAGATQVVEEGAKVGTEVVEEVAKVGTEVVEEVAKVGTQVVEEVATLATAGATKVVEEVAKVGTEVGTQVGEPNVQGAPKDAASEVPTQILEEGAKPSAYSYVSGLIGAAFAKAKSVVAPAAIGTIFVKLRIKNAALKAQAAQEVAKDSVVEDTAVTPA